MPVHLRMHDILNYSHLKSLAKEYSALFLFETNVGAGLPVIGTLNDLRRSGDVVTKIQKLYYQAL